MSNVINKIRLSGTDYTLSATSSGGASAVEVTQAEYDALVSGGTVDPTVFYIITDAQPADMSKYWTSAQTNSAINAAVSGKQDTLSAGTGIDITDNVISATGGGGGKAVSGGTNIRITTGETADTINCTLPISATSSNINLSLFGNSQAIQNTYSVNFGYSNSFGTNPTWIYNYGTNNSTPMYGNKYYVNFGEYNSLEGYGFEYTFGNYLKSVNQYEFACGKYNKSNSGTLFSVGNGTGTSTSARHNAFEIRQNGDIYYFDGTNDVKLQDKFSTIDTTIGNINTILESI